MNKTVHLIYVGTFFVVGILVLILLAFNGYQYYSLPVEERFFNASHSVLKPSGVWGHGFGIIGTLMMIVGVAIYMIRKRSRKLFTFGYYIQIPRTIQGKEIDIKDLISMREELVTKMKMEMLFDVRLITELDELASTDRYKGLGILNTFIFYIKDFFKIRSFQTKLKKNLLIANFSKIKRKEITNKAQAEIILSRRLGMLHTMQSLFRYWHIAHLPFAIAMFVIMIVHVVVTLTFGYKCSRMASETKVNEPEIKA